MRARRIMLLSVVALLMLCVAGTTETHAAGLGSQLVVGFPFSDDFELGISTNWLSSKTDFGVVESNTDYAHDSKQSVFIGQRLAGPATAELVLPVDLKGREDVFLDFWWRATGNAVEGANGVYISDNDGTTWQQILILNANSHSYSHELINLASAATLNGKNLNEKFRIRIFFQGTFFSNPDDGIVVDDLRLTTRVGNIAASSFESDSFEESSFSQGFFPHSSNKGSVQFSTDYAHDSTQSVFIGQRLAGPATAELELAIDLKGREDVFLDFWWRATGNAVEGANGVYISDNDGATWQQILILNANSHSYSHELINLASAETLNGKNLNEKFRIRIFFQGTFFSNPDDGIVIDDLRLTTRDKQLISFPFELDSFETEVFQQGIYPRSSNKGEVVIDGDAAHTGAKKVSLGQKIPGAATAEINFAIDLSNQSNVYFDFWWRATGNAQEGANGVYISDNEGASWTQVKVLNSNEQGYKHEVIDIVKVSSANGKELNNKFRIRIFFQGTFFSASGDGLVLDDIRMGKKDPSDKVYLPSIVNR